MGLGPFCGPGDWSLLKNNLVFYLWGFLTVNDCDYWLTETTNFPINIHRKTSKLLLPCAHFPPPCNFQFPLKSCSKYHWCQTGSVKVTRGHSGPIWQHTEHSVTLSLSTGAKGWLMVRAFLSVVEWRRLYSIRGRVGAKKRVKRQKFSVDWAWKPH